MRARNHRRSVVTPRLCLWGLLLISGWAQAENVIPADEQATLFKKIIAYDRSLPESRRHVAVVHGGNAEAVATDIAQAFEKQGMKAPVVRSDALASLPDTVGVLYVVSGADLAKVKETCLKNKRLSVSGVVKLVEAGDASVALRRGDGGRTEIVIHVARAEQEQQTFSAGLLSLAKLIK